MSVTKIRKTSSWIFTGVTLINITILLVYYLGGSVDSTAEVPVPVNVDYLLYWLYTLLGATVGLSIFFAGLQMAKLLKEDTKSGLISLGAVAALVGMMFLYFTIGDPTPLPLIGYEGSENVPFWLKMADMWLYAIYTLLALIIACIAWGNIKKVLDK
jgi:hypothetical protein